MSNFAYYVRKSCLLRVNLKQAFIVYFAKCVTYRIADGSSCSARHTIHDYFTKEIGTERPLKTELKNYNLYLKAI